MTLFIVILAYIIAAALFVRLLVFIYWGLGGGKPRDGRKGPKTWPRQ